MSKPFRCFIHRGPCNLILENKRFSLERHSNGVFTWWEVYDKQNFTTENFHHKKDAILSFSKRRLRR